MKHLKFILPAMLILSACGKASTESPGSQNVTYLDMEQVLDNENLKSNEEIVDLIESLNVVQLETTDSEESMIGEYMGTNFVDGDNIIVTCKFNSNYPVKIFDGNGKFKFAIRIGEGPDEYLPFSNISYDYDNHLIMTISQNHLRFFNLDGHVVKDTILPFDAIEIQRTGDYYVLRHSGFSEEEYLRNKRLLVTDTLFNPIVGLYDFDANGLSAIIEGSYNVSNNGLYCHELFRDTILFVKDTVICENLVIKSDQKLEPGMLPSPEDPEWFLKQPDAYFFSQFVQAGNAQYIFIVRSKEENYSLFRNAVSGNVAIPKDGFHFLTRPMGFAGADAFLTYINGFYDDETRDECLKFVKKYPKFSKYQDIFEKYNEETDNPIFIFFKMKDF